jgi:hypothetical protein
MRKYTTKGNIENYLLQEIDSSLDDQIDNWIEAVTKYIENYTGRVFEAEEETRLFDGNNRITLTVGDFISISEIKLGLDYWGDDTETITDYLVLPINYEEDGIPADTIFLKSQWFIRGVGNHSVTAMWGYSETVPTDIELAATMITSKIIQKHIITQGDIESEKIGDYSITTNIKEQIDDKVKPILDSYTKYYL